MTSLHSFYILKQFEVYTNRQSFYTIYFLNYQLKSSLKIRPGMSPKMIFGVYGATFGVRGAAFGMPGMTFGVHGAAFGMSGMTFGILGMTFGILGATFGMLGATFGMLGMTFGMRVATFWGNKIGKLQIKL
jgi:hypothetical protein